MKNQSYKNIGRVTILLLVLLSFFSCGGAEKSVRNGRIKLDESITLGDAFDKYQYFTGTEWESFKDSQGREIVQVTGNIDMSKMFITDSVNMLEGQGFENGLLQVLLSQAGSYQNSGQNIVSQGDWEELVEMKMDRHLFRHPKVLEIIDNYEKYPDDCIRLAKKYMSDWEQYSGEYAYPPLMDGHKPIMELFADAKWEEGIALYNETAAYMSANIKGSKGHYLCQFAIEEDGFTYYAGEVSFTLDVNDASGPVTFNLPESTDSLPYLISVYQNARFME